MNFIFRSNASTNEKIWTVILLFTIGLVIWGLKNNFIPSSSYIHWAVLAGGVFGIIFSIPIIRDKHPANKVQGLSRGRRILIYAFVLVFIPLFFITSAVYSFPLIATKLFGENSSQVVLVSKKEKDNGMRRVICRNTLILKDVDLWIKRGVCVAGELWDSVDVGDEIVMETKKTRSGSAVLTIIKNNRSQ